MPRTKPTLEGLYCLPTATKFHMTDLARSTASSANQFCYLLEATQTVGEGGYPFQIVLTSHKDLGLDIDDVVQTQHAEVRKNLPPRRVVGMIFPNGETDGILTAEGVGLPHWEFIDVRDDGKGPNQAQITATKMRILRRRASDEDATKVARELRAQKAS